MHLLALCCAQWCLALCEPVDCSSLVSSVHGISQARILAWVVISSSRESSPPRDQTHVSCVSCISCVSCTDWEAESLPLSHLGNNSSKWLSGLLPFQSVTIWWLTYPWKFFLLSFKCLAIVFTISKCVCAHTYTGMYMHKFFFPYLNSPIQVDTWKDK